MHFINKILLEYRRDNEDKRDTSNKGEKWTDDELKIILCDVGKRHEEKMYPQSFFTPMYNGYRYQAIHLHGHSHFTDEVDIEIDIAEQFNKQGFHTETYKVGCMYWNYEPVTLDEIIAHGKMVRPNYGTWSDNVETRSE